MENTKTQTIEYSLKKTPTGVKGLDEILEGGLPQGRSTLVCGGAGTGKTLLAVEFLVKGAKIFEEPGVFISFEETLAELAQNTASLDIDLMHLIDEGKIFVDYVYVERSEIEETGVYDLEGLFLRLDDAIQHTGARRVVLDSLETLFSGFTDTGILRAELRRLFRYLKEKDLTAVITAESGDGQLTRHGLEEYISDCVITLDNRIQEGLSTRRLRVIKYRGSRHGNDEYPFIIDHTGYWIMPITSIKLDYSAPLERVSSGISELDAMLEGGGYYRGSSILVSGTAGTGKTSIAAHFVDAACRRGERCLFFAHEESNCQILRNMRSIGIDLEPWIQQGLLNIQSARVSKQNMESHLLKSHQLVESFHPNVLVIDPVSDFMAIGTPEDVKSMLIRMIDSFKSNGITTLFTHLTKGADHEQSTEMGISSLIDTWLLLRYLEANGTRSRNLYVLKSRGMDHSNELRNFQITDHGIQLQEFVNTIDDLHIKNPLIREK
ncbi:MAG: circadian clock protein KaiC [Anaerolineales bacterium]|jgi:circadian clock protein KaiC